MRYLLTFVSLILLASCSDKSTTQATTDTWLNLSYSLNGKTIFHELIDGNQAMPVTKYIVQGQDTLLSAEIIKNIHQACYPGSVEHTYFTVYSKRPGYYTNWSQKHDRESLTLDLTADFVKLPDNLFCGTVTDQFWGTADFTNAYIINENQEIDTINIDPSFGRFAVDLPVGNYRIFCRGSMDTISFNPSVKYKDFTFRFYIEI